jgi:hypothetical protein
MVCPIKGFDVAALFVGISLANFLAGPSLTDSVDVCSSGKEFVASLALVALFAFFVGAGRGVSLLAATFAPVLVGSCIGALAVFEFFLPLVTTFGGGMAT